MHFERDPPSRAEEPETGPEGQRHPDPDPLPRKGHPVPAARAHRLEVQRFQGVPQEAEASHVQGGL